MKKKVILILVSIVATTMTAFGQWTFTIDYATMTSGTYPASPFTGMGDEIKIINNGALDPVWSVPTNLGYGSIPIGTTSLTVLGPGTYRVLIGSKNIAVSVGSGTTQYTITVTGGTASPSSGPTGTVVTLTPGTPPSGKQFKQWNVLSGGVSVSGNTLTIGTANVSVEAIWEDIPETTYTVTVTGGTASPSSGPTGTVVTLTPGTPPSGKQFKQWNVLSGGVTVSGNTLTIGSANVSVEAVWEDDVTANEAIEAKILKAWTQNSVLHVKGLQPGKSWYVYSLTGSLVYTGVAAGSEATLFLPGRGMYIVNDGEFAVKVMN